MKVHEFYGKFANTPIDNRFNVINFNELGMMSLYDVYKRMNELEDIMRPYRIEQDKLLSVITNLKTFKGVDVFKDKLKEKGEER